MYLIVLILLVEIVLRIPAVNNRLPAPEPTLWPSSLTQVKLDYLKSFEENRGIDILFIGNSTTQAGIDPQSFDLARGKSDENGSGSFNGSLEGLPPFGVLIFLEIYLRYTNPDIIIYGISPQDLNSNSPWAHDVSERVKRSPMALAEAQRGSKGKIIAALLHNSYLYRYRFVLHQLLLSGKLSKTETNIYFDDRGYHPINRRLSDVDEVTKASFYNRAGVMNYSTKGEQLSSLRSLLKFCDDYGIPIILVNMPLAVDYFGNFDSLSDYDTYSSTVYELVGEWWVPYWDIGNFYIDNGFEDHHFADFNHLNKSGAQKLSQILADLLEEMYLVDNKQIKH
jgi:hypothetical protein